MKKNSTNGIEEFVSSFDKLIHPQNGFTSDVIFYKNLVINNLELIRQKRYAITYDIWTLGEHDNLGYLRSLVRLIRSFAGEYEKDAGKLLACFKETTSFGRDFTYEVLAGDQRKIIAISRQKGISLDFLTFFAVLAAIPYRKAVADLVTAEMDLKNHVSGYCPVCGHWPVMSYIMGKEGKRVMACICCGTAWSFRRLTCPFCLNRNHDDLGYLHIEEEKAFSAYICRKCKRYLKTKVVPDDLQELSLVAVLTDYLQSANLDVASVQNRFVTESLLGTRFEGPLDTHIDAYIKVFQ